MDRFIDAHQVDVDSALGNFKIQYGQIYSHYPPKLILLTYNLKSSMDRFIVINTTNIVVSNANLKSSMDRFIESFANYIYNVNDI